MIYLLTAVGLPPGGRSTVHVYTQTIYRTTQNKQYIEQHKNFGRMWAVPLAEEKAQMYLSQGSQTIRIHRRNNKNT